MKTPLRVHYFQHIQDEGLGSPAAWLARHDAVVTTSQFYRLKIGEDVCTAIGKQRGQEAIILPQHDDVDLLIIMGGEMSVNDEDKYPWLISEKRWLRKYVALGKPVVGLCLGAQLIASSLGATISKNALKEVGWWPVRARAIDSVQKEQGEVFEFPDEVTALSWHEDTYTLPPDAVGLAESDACAQQAFQYGDRALGFQFHAESTPRNLQLFLVDSGYQHLGASPASHRYIQPPAQIARAVAADFVAANAVLERALDFVTREIGEG
jgi:GMP synthase-like glutamine amidotransferase